MPKNGIKIQGLDKLLLKVAKLDANLQADIFEEVKATAIEIDALANQNIRNIPKAYSLGELLAGQHFNEVSPGTWQVSNDDAKAGYIEFGTGARVRIPAGFEELAAEWKNRPGGDMNDFLDRLEVWMKGVSIEGGRGVAYVIAIHILNNGLIARPFFIPAFLQGGANLLPRIETIIGEAFE